MKTITRPGLAVVVAIVSIVLINTAKAEPTEFEWSSTTGFLSSRSQTAIEEITGQTAFPVLNGTRWVVPGDMSGVFVYDRDRADPPLQFGNFTHYVGASFAATSYLSTATGLIGTTTADIGRVIVSDSGGGQNGNQDVVNVNLCCGTGFTVGSWRATGSSVVWVGEGFQNGQELPVTLPPAGAAEPLGLINFFNEATGENVSILSVGLDLREAVQTVEIDIKPGSDPNCFNINGHGVIPVAILGSPVFFISDIDQTSLTFGGLSVQVRGNKYPQCNGEYSNDDEFLDLVCHFEDDSSAWVEGGDEATLSGKLLGVGGSKFEGTDSICLVP
jgi:hypothetical protein